jgi:hypothetical protein
MTNSVGRWYLRKMMDFKEEKQLPRKYLCNWTEYINQSVVV